MSCDDDDEDVGRRDTSPPPLLASRLRWDVFISFKGEDIDDHFTDRLFSSLEQHGIRVCHSKTTELTQEDKIEAANDSAVSIVIISPNFASRSCLEELDIIFQSQRLTIPLFYGVDPSHVRRQEGPFELPFQHLLQEFNGDNKLVVGWRKAMERAGGIAGLESKSSEEQHLIDTLVTKILHKLSNAPVHVAEYTVGLDSRVQEVITRFVDLKFKETRVLGLHGMGGVGKTTLVKTLYNKLVRHFEYRSFISNTRATAENTNGFVSLQTKLIRDLCKVKLPMTTDINEGILKIKEIIHKGRALIVLDDVDDISQIDALAIKKEWFYEGSLILITTRNVDILQLQNVIENYEVKELGSDEALQLFSYRALRLKYPTEKFLKLSENIVSVAGGLPLALEVFGSFLSDKKNIDEWEDALQKLKQIRPRSLHDVLKISFDGLGEEEKCTFLDISCLFVQMKMKREDVVDVLNGCGFQAERALSILKAKSLIKIIEGEDNIVWMHDQLRDMGRQIVQSESPLNPGNRSRLWKRDEIMTVLEHNQGTESIQGVVLDFAKKRSVKDQSSDTILWSNFLFKPSCTSLIIYVLEVFRQYFHPDSEDEMEVVIQSQSFKEMVNLRLLQINHVNLEGNANLISDELKWLQWKGCPLKSLPRDFSPCGLTVLDMSDSLIRQLWGRRWKFWYNNKVAEKLKVLNLRGCYNLTALPDLSRNRHLEKIILDRCIALTEIHKSIGNATALIHMDLSNCSNLIKLPGNVSELKHLEIFILSGCSKLRLLPEGVGEMKSLRELLCDKTALSKLPDSICGLTKLERLSLDGCNMFKYLPESVGELCSLKELTLMNSALVSIPDSIASLENLERLNLMHCSSLASIPDSIGNLKSLSKFLLNNTPIKELPSSISSLFYLKDLSLGYCKSLIEMPISIGALASIMELDLDVTPITKLPQQIGELKSLKILTMRDCKSLKSLPESLGDMLSLTTLIIVNAAITELPKSLGMLENLSLLRINGCKHLCKLPDSMGNIKSLRYLYMEGTSVTELPSSFGELSKLMVLKMAKKAPFETNHSYTVPPSFSNLFSLEEFDARHWRIIGKIPEEFKKLSALEVLNLGHNDFCSLPSSLIDLVHLKKLFIPSCKELEALPVLPSSLEEVNAADCTKLECIADLSNLENLEELRLTNCEKVVDVPGLECMKSLKRLYLGGCNASSSLVKKRISKVALRNIRNISIPGSDIPNWFSQESVKFSIPKNRVIEGMLIGVIVALNDQFPDESYDLPAIVDIQARILKLNHSIFNTTLYLMGVPRTQEDQFHLCRFSKFHPLVSMLKEGYNIEVLKRNSPYSKGVELKKYGIQPVFEGDDDYAEKEDFLDENEQSISARLVNFFQSMELRLKLELS